LEFPIIRSFPIEPLSGACVISTSQLLSSSTGHANHECEILQPFHHFEFVMHGIFRADAKDIGPSEIRIVLAEEHQSIIGAHPGACFLRKLIL